MNQNDQAIKLVGKCSISKNISELHYQAETKLTIKCNNDSYIIYKSYIDMTSCP